MLSFVNVVVVVIKQNNYAAIKQAFASVGVNFTADMAKFAHFEGVDPGTNEPFLRTFVDALRGLYDVRDQSCSVTEACGLTLGARNTKSSNED